MLLLAALALLIGISYAKANDVSYLCQFPQEWKADHSFEDPDSPGTFYTCEVYAGWVTGSGGGPTDVDASWTCAGTTQTEQYHVDTVSKFGCCGPSGKSACCSQIVTWRPGAEDECSPSPGPPPVYASPPPPTVVSYCLPRQDWQYHCEPYPNCDPSTCDPNTTGELECFMAQLSCSGGCNTGHNLQGDTFDQCNQCLSNNHTGLDGSTTCDGTCTPGDATDPCFKGSGSTLNPSKPPLFVPGTDEVEMDAQGVASSAYVSSSATTLYLALVAALGAADLAIA